MKKEEVLSYVADCFNGDPASCSYACPFGLDIRSFLQKVAKGRWGPAYKQLRNAVVFPAVVSALCPQPCRDCCQRSLVGDEPLAVRDIEEACIRYVKSPGQDRFVIPPKSHRVAVIGAGVAGLSCALSLAQKKYIVTIFDKAPGWGGSLRQHDSFPEFEKDFELQFSGVDADFRFNTEIKSLTELEGFDAVFVATGKNGSDFGLPGTRDSGLYTTSHAKVFLGGELTGVSLIEAIAQGADASKIIETFLQTGRAFRPEGSKPGRNKCGRNLPHEGAERRPLVQKADGEAYTEEEAKAEADRCLQCDCNLCKTGCEMVQWYQKMPPRIGLEVHSDSIASAALASKTMTREAYSCNICGYCKSVCPVDVDIGALLQLSRTDRMRSGKHIPAFHDFWLRDMDFNASQAALAAAPKGKASCETAFFPGCKLGASNPQHVLKTYDYLEEKYGAGILLNCCGAPAYWAGDEKRLNAHLEGLRQSWTALGRPKLVFACATCEKMFREFLPDIPQVSLYKLLAADEKIVPALQFPEVNIFDPCAARDDPDMQASVRRLAARSGAVLEELMERNRCCGFGGHMWLANPELYDLITARRAEAGNKPYIVYCANCRDAFRLRGKDCTHVLDTVFNMDAGAPVPSLQKKKENTLEVKKNMMKKISGADFIPETHEWDGLRLIMSDKLRDELDRKLVVEDDLKEAIWLAGQTGETFYDEAGDLWQCSMVKPEITYWVQFKKISPGKYEILDAFTHRMRFSREG